MDKYSEILTRLGRIEGQLVGISKISERVSQLEMWQSWLKGGYAAIAALYAYLSRTIHHG